ncbi:MAG: hypothetical protein ABSE63_10435 [Thermoguttaceae bacterium]|jgi:hypothetical protein
MAIQPFEWSVVIVGRWNRAILTPAGIAKRVFKLEDQKQVPVLVPLDGISPYLVKHPEYEIIVCTDEKSLQIRLEKFDYDTLAQAMVFGSNAIMFLPETPLVAVGVNVNFEIPNVTPPLASLLAGDIDKSLSTVNYNVISRSVVRSFVFGEGQLNTTIIIENGSFKIMFNFHRSSTNIDPEKIRIDLENWLKTPKEQIHNTVDNILQALQIELEDSENDSQQQ